MASNIVLVFHKKPPSKFTWTAEIRSQSENSSRPPQQFCVLLHVGKQEGGHQTIVSKIPMIKEDIPVAILLRALNIISDKQIQDLIVYDQTDTDMIDML